LTIQQSALGIANADCEPDCAGAPGWGVVLTAAPLNESNFVRWWCYADSCLNADLSANPLNLTLIDDVTVIPVFSLKQATLNLLGAESEGGTAIASCDDDCGSDEAGWTAELTATPHKPYTFIRWACSGELCPSDDVLSSNPVTISVEGNLSLEPVFNLPATLEFVPDAFETESWSLETANATLQAYDYEISLGEQAGGLLHPLLNVHDEVNPDIIHTTKLIRDYRPDDRIFNTKLAALVVENPNVNEQILYHHTFESPYAVESANSTIGIMYPAGTPGIPGVDVDRSTLRVIAAEANHGIVSITADERNIRYTPNSETANRDVVSFTVETNEDGIRKTAQAEITVTLESEDYDQNERELNRIISNSFNASTRSIRDNFRFADGAISNEDLSIIQFFDAQNFSDASVRTIMRIPEQLSPIREISPHTLRKLRAVEVGLFQNLFQNQNFNESAYSAVYWPFQYREIMRRAAFAIPQFVEILESSKTINYLKSDLDEVFPSLGGEYTGLFSRGETYAPTHACWDDLAAALQNHPSNERNAWRDGECIYYTEGGLLWLDKGGNPYSGLNELIIHFTMLAVLNEFDLTIGSNLSEIQPSEYPLLFGPADARSSGGPRAGVSLKLSSVGGNIYVWENAKYDNGETTNIYSLARGIIGTENLSVAETLLRLMDWYIDYSYHAIGEFGVNSSPDVNPEEKAKLLSLPNDSSVPAAYFFMLYDLGGVNFGGSSTTAFAMTAALRSLNILADNLRLFYNNGHIVVDGENWYFEGNFPFGASAPNACNALIHESEITDAVIENYRHHPDAFAELVGVSTQVFVDGQTEFCERYDPEVFAQFTTS